MAQKWEQLFTKVAAVYVQIGQSSVKYVVPKAQTFWKFARVELKPPQPAEFGKVSESLGNLVKSATTGKWKNTTVKEAVANTCVAVEVGCWFFIGEIIGKRSFIGYHVEGAEWKDFHM